MNEYRVEPLSAENFEAFASLHSGPGCAGCYCMYWHYAQDNRAWQMELPENNRAAKLARVREGSTRGVLAFEARDGVDLCVGSMQIEPRSSLLKLTARMPYRDLPADPGRWSVGCVLVRESHRRRGVARALLRGAIDQLRATATATALEAYPRLGDELRDEEQWTGPESLFAREGFTVLREHMQYPVLVLALR
ncbi:MAG: GNAT family N-acetyltransferase [Polyangiales bacterium]